MKIFVAINFLKRSKTRVLLMRFEIKWVYTDSGDEPNVCF